MRVASAGRGAALGIALCLALAPVIARAQESTAQKQVGLVRTGAGTFSMDVEGADIRSVLRAVAEFSGRNIVVGKDVRGTVKVTLRNVGWAEALRTILRSNNLDYVDEGGILRVDEASRLHAEAVDREAARARQMDLMPLETRTVRLNYANASELSVGVQAMLTRRGTVQVDKRTNTLIITDLPSTAEAATRMAAELDSRTPQIEITAKLVDVDASALQDLGVVWNAMRPEAAPGVPEAVSVTEPKEPSSGSLAFGFIRGKDRIRFEAAIQMLEESRKANIISNPRITTVDNREAKIVVGQKIPLIVQDVAGNPVSQLQTIGIQLRVTPHLTEDRKIIMDLHPEVSDLSTQSTVQGGVIINTSEADTRVMVEDGQTAVIGGLIRTNESTVRRGIPLLKDLPGLGVLFRSSNKVQQSRELIIFVTPRLIGDLASN